MPHFILYPLSFVLVLGIMIVVHEWGHYAAAKLLGVRVEVFSVGFGPRLLGFRRGDTDYRISAIPLGGYVKMSGENPMEEATGDPGEFMSHPRWHRFLIAVAGPFMNVALAVVLLAGLYVFHFEQPSYFDNPARVGWVKDGSPAAKVGIRPGDVISNINGTLQPTWKQVMFKAALSPGQPMQVAVQRDAQTLNLSVVPDASGADRYGSAGWWPEQPVEVTSLGKVGNDEPAIKAGIQLGDVITRADDVTLTALPTLFEHLQDGKGKPADLTILRRGQEMKVTVQPVLDKAEGENEAFYRIGVGSERITVRRLPLTEAWRTSLAENRENSLMLGELLQKLIRGKASIKQISGPIGIGQAAGDAVEEGLQEKNWFRLFRLVTMISLNLGIFNLLPIPIMDGGVILLLLLESLMRRDISLIVKERIYQTAFVFLVLFASVVIFNDVTKVFSSGRLP
jgi:regulator of sigma E protease